MAEQHTSEELVASWFIGEAELQELGGISQCARFAIGDEQLVMLGLEVEFLKKLAGVLYQDVDVRIVVTRSK
jgi:hypothetical protein